MHPSAWEYLEWDEANVAHLARHGVTDVDVEQLLRGATRWRRNRRGRSGDWLVEGRTAGGRELQIVVAWDERRRILLPITGWER